MNGYVKMKKEIYLNESEILNKLNTELVKEINLQQLTIEKVKIKVNTASTDKDYNLNKRILVNLQSYVHGLQYSLKLIQNEIFKKR